MKIKGFNGHDGINRRKYRFQESVVLETEFSSKSSKSGMGLSGMDTTSNILRFYYILALAQNKCSNNHQCHPKSISIHNSFLTFFTFGAEERYIKFV